MRFHPTKHFLFCFLFLLPLFHTSYLHHPLSATSLHFKTFPPLTLLPSISSPLFLAFSDVTSRIISGTRVLAASRWWPSSRWCVWPWAPRLWWSCCSSWSSSALPRSSTCSRRRTRSCVSAGEAEFELGDNEFKTVEVLNLLHLFFLAKWVILPQLANHDSLQFREGKAWKNTATECENVFPRFISHDVTKGLK